MSNVSVELLSQQAEMLFLNTIEGINYETQNANGKNRQLQMLNTTEILPKMQ